MLHPKWRAEDVHHFGWSTNPEYRYEQGSVERSGDAAGRRIAVHVLYQPGDTAWDELLRAKIMPNSTLKGRANLFVLPNLDAANIAYNMVRVVTDGVAIGPILMGISKPVHILTTSATPRRVINMTAIAAVDAQIRLQRDAERNGPG